MRKITGALLFAAALAMPALAEAQTCECINGIKCYVVNGVTICDPNIKCEGTFLLNPPIPPIGRVASSGIPQSLTAKTNTPLGPTTIALDPSRPAGPTTLASNGTTRFPLTVDIRFNATATVDNLRGLPIRNVQELHYRTTTANSVNPFQGVVLILQNDVDFVRDGELVFTLKAGTSSINLGPDTPEGT